MEAAVRAREAGREAVRDVTPKPLRDRIHALLDESSMLPGVLTLSSARVADGEGTRSDGVANRAAGVQLIYEGLRLTRSLAVDAPWDREPPYDDANLGILAADAMVARGFYLLARTEAADKAVETVKSFGRDRTDAQAGRDAPARALEADVFELAIVAGATAVDREPPEVLLSYAADLAADDDPDPPEEVSEAVTEAMTDFSPRTSLGRGPRPSATDP
ncbi:MULTISPECIES: DUF7114 family protein [Halorussus]|uniref:DUF7114 family protein n=1 Tax=Halorussus TaxID=1070314 RepID=UPI0020A0B4E9|nr:hypothetical protein [Halorussus vallis]USZ77557.1 hypothetical protein NGM07_09520 [Halorussus vallis]